MSEPRREDSGAGFYLVTGAVGALIVCAGVADEDLASRVLGGAMMVPGVLYSSALVGGEIYEAIVKYEKVKRAKNIMRIRDCRRES